MAPMALSIRNLCKSFRVPRIVGINGAGHDPRRRRDGRHDRLDVLRDVTFDIPQGQTLGVVGANGSGKTTLLKILAGVMVPDSGATEINGKIGALLEVGAGFHPDLTGEENVQLNAAILGLSRAEMAKNLAEIIAFAELERFMDMPVRHYSSGMIVRLGFAVAIQMKPDILLLDETFAVGDAHFKARALARIRQMRTEGVTMLLVSHNAELIIELAERAIWLDRGQVAMDGVPHEVLATYGRKCGSVVLSGERMGSRMIGQEAFMPVRAERSPVRIISTKIQSENSNVKSQISDTTTPPADSSSLILHPSSFPVESRDPLNLQITLECEADINPSDYILDVWFLRDDHRVVAQSRTTLEGAKNQGASGPASLSLRYDPISLGNGEYEITLTILRRGAELAGEVCDRLTLQEKFKIVTPLPLDFRIAAEVEAKWER